MANTKKTVKKKKKWHNTEIVAMIVLTLLAILIVVPFWNAIVISFESAAEYTRHPFSWLPRKFTLENYKYLLGRGSALLSAYRSTILLTIGGTAAGMTVSTMVAYAYSRDFPGRKLFFRMMILTMFLGGGVIPTYMLIRNLGLLDTYTGIVLLSLASSYNIIIMKNGFEAVPMDLQDAAMIDGASDMKIFFLIMLPLQKPLLATFSLFSAVGYWNTWYWPLLLLNSGKKSVLQLFLRSIINNASRSNMAAKTLSSVARQTNLFSEGIQMASVFAVMLPIMVVYPFLQKYFVKGVLIGAVKM
ncbi:carbohydrate ABC transporter permease [uncultured Acetatifactor sp.]|uniref:carbohydrate ABC transporter permease n=1 Tax=uncultured Acetatifactor sp. TaxID=1671927 RepID=UPI0026101635|nr:carbohydrate ABC transporter permease [uncultured Acetatifactor sp.]